LLATDLTTASRNTYYVYSQARVSEQARVSDQLIKMIATGTYMYWELLEI